ncbi:MAG: hypothetical protein ACC657_11040 [Thiohalomonadales bacterium]
MFKGLFGDKKSTTRELKSANDLLPGDLVSFKDRLSLPKDIQGQQFELTEIAGYYYSDGIVPELTLRNADNETYFLSPDDNDGDPRLLISRKLTRKQVLQLFDEDEFAKLFEDGTFPCLKVQDNPAELEGWLNDNYQQEEKSVEAYYYERNCAINPPNKFDDDDDGEELRYHECEAADNNYILTVEIWDDGSTDVILGLYCTEDVVEHYWPKND